MFPIPFNFPFRKANGDISTIGAEISAGGGGGSSYTLPTASASTKGGVKIGEGLTMDGEVLKNNNPTPTTPYILPTASAETLGGIKVGSNLSIDENGVLSASGGGGGGGGSSSYRHTISYYNATGNAVRGFIIEVVTPRADPVVSSSVNWTIDTFIRNLRTLNNKYDNGSKILISGIIKDNAGTSYTSIAMGEIKYDSGLATWNILCYRPDGTYGDLANATAQFTGVKDIVY